MGIIKEPNHIDLVVDGRALKAKDLEKLDEAISQYKAMEKLKKADLRRVKKAFSST